jgi:transposase
VWSRIGQTPVLKVHPGRESIHFYGALNLRDGREVALPVEETTSTMTANFLMILLLLFPQSILLLLDRAPWHFGEVTELLEQTERLQVVYLPPACPALNPQEHVWERARDAVSHNHSYRRFQPLIDDFEEYLNDTCFSTNFMDAFLPLGLGIF